VRTSCQLVLHSFKPRYALRAQVEHANSGRLSALQGDTQIYQAHDVPGIDITGSRIDGKRAAALADQTLALRELPLKIGAQVMLIMVCRVYIINSLPYLLVTNISYHRQNLTKTSYALVNGSLGIVKDFVTVRQARESGVPGLDDYLSKEKSYKPTVDLPHRGGKWPVVHFHKSDDTLLLTPTKFEVVNGLGDVEATREQVNYF